LPNAVFAQHYGRLGLISTVHNLFEIRAGHFASLTLNLYIFHAL
jgi:hypothetical protein